MAVIGPGVVQGRLSAHARPVMHAMAVAILEGSLPKEDGPRALALEGVLDRIDGLVGGLPAHAQKELSQLLAVLASSAGRQLVAGLDGDWSVAPVASVQGALQSMRTSTIAVRQQAYHGLHDLIGAAYLSDSDTWAVIGYPGPIPLPSA